MSCSVKDHALAVGVTEFGQECLCAGPSAELHFVAYAVELVNSPLVLYLIPCKTMTASKREVECWGHLLTECWS